MEIYRLIFSPIDVNTYVLADKEGNCAIVDCGCYDDKEFLRLVKFIETRNLNPVLLLNTHCHLDHVFGNKYVFDKYNLKTYCSELEESNLINSPEHATYFGLSMDIPPQPEGYIIHGQTIAFGSTNLLALSVPGHSMGSIAFYNESDGCVLTGDALFSGGIGRTDLPGGDYQTLIDSIRNNLLTLPPETIVYPGHGAKTTIEKETKTNPFLK